MNYAFECDKSIVYNGACLSSQSKCISACFHGSCDDVYWLFVLALDTCINIHWSYIEVLLERQTIKKGVHIQDSFQSIRSITSYL